MTCLFGNSYMHSGNFYGRRTNIQRFIRCYKVLVFIYKNTYEKKEINKIKKKKEKV